MGGAASNPYDDAAQKETKEVINETVLAFNKEYPLQLAAVLTKKIKAEVMAGDKKDEDTKRELSTDPHPPQTAALEGYLTKQGIVRKNWKKRYFVVQPDYNVIYCETKETQAKPLGKINLNGYWVEKFESKERPWTLVCKHWRRRHWYLQCEDEKAFKDWKDVLQLCTRNAPSPMSQDPVHRPTYQRAYLKIWNLYWGWNWGFSCTGSEAEMLGDLIMRRLRWGVLWRVNSKLTGPAKMQSMMREQIDKQVKVAVDAAAEGCWKGTVEARAKIQPEMEKAIKAEATPIFELQKKIKDTIKEKIMSVVEPVLEKVVKPLVDKVLSKALDPIAEAHIETYKVFDKAVKHIQNDYKADWTKSTQVNWWLYYWMWDARNLLWNMNNDDTVRKALTPSSSGGGGNDEAGDKKEDGPSNAGIAWRIGDELHQLVKDAVFTLTQDKDPAVVGKKLLNDSKAILTEEYRGFLLGVIQPNLYSAVKGNLLELCKTFDDQIPEVLKNFVSAEELAEELINDISSDIAETILKSAAPANIEKLEKGMDGIAKAESKSA